MHEKLETVEVTVRCAEVRLVRVHDGLLEKGHDNPDGDDSP